MTDMKAAFHSLYSVLSPENMGKGSPFSLTGDTWWLEDCIEWCGVFICVMRSCYCAVTLYYAT